MVRDQANTKRITVAKKFGRLHVFGIIVAMTFLVVGAVTVLSRQPAKVESKKQKATSPMPDKPQKNYVTVKVAGQDTKVNSQTDQIQHLTPEEANKLANVL